MAKQEIIILSLRGQCKTHHASLDSGEQSLCKVNDIILAKIKEGIFDRINSTSIYNGNTMILPQLKLLGMAGLLHLFPGMNYTYHAKIIESIGKVYEAIILPWVKLYLSVTIRYLFGCLEHLLCSKGTVQLLKATWVTLKHKSKWLLI